MEKSAAAASASFGRRRYVLLHRQSLCGAHAVTVLTTVRDVARALEERDHADRTRSVSPLTKAEDAILIDTTNVSIAGVVETVIALIKEKCS